MTKRIKPIKMGEFLKMYMEPYHLSAYKLAKDIRVPVSRIQDILHDRRKLSVDTSMRLGKYFGVDDLFFFRVQLELDYRKAKAEMENELELIKYVDDNIDVLFEVNEEMKQELDTIMPVVNPLLKQ